MVLSKRRPIRSAYCTVLSEQRLPQALVLQKSISVHSPDSIFGFFCIDRAAAAFLKTLDLKNVEIFEPDEFVPPVLQAMRSTLKVVEYCAICKPVALTHAFKVIADVNWAVWVDSDMLAFGNLDSVLAANAEANVVLTPHRFLLPEFKHLESIVGLFNAGYVAFQKTNEGQAALNWWMERCLESCPVEPTETLFGDQKYLNAIPQLFSNVAEAAAGVNSAPWNIVGVTVERCGAEVLVSGSPLVLYHFQGLRVIRHWLFDLYASKLKLPAEVREFVYKPYVAALADQLRAVGVQHGGSGGEFTSLHGLYRLALSVARSPNVAIHFSGIA